MLFAQILLSLISQSPASIYHDGWIDFNKNGTKDVYEDPKAPLEKRVNDLVRQMNVDEKTCQMATLYGYKRILKDPLPTPEWKKMLWKDGIANIDEQLNGFSYVYDEVNGKSPKTDYLWDTGLHAEALQTIQKWFVEETRLGIPVDFTDEGIRGVENTIATGFPSQIAMGATWNPELVRKEGEITGREAYLLGYTNVYSPILDVGRDPRWGRTEEGYSEDPFLVMTMGVEAVKGIKSQGVASTAKHFAVYGQNKGGREGNSRTSPQVDSFDVENIHLRPWRAAFEAGIMGIMSSYNDYDGLPITGSSYWLQDRLRKDLGFTGYVVSDSEAVEYLALKHHVAANQKEAVYQAVMAGLNVRTTFRTPETYVLPLRELISEKRIPMSVIDSRVKDVLRVKFKIGLFDKPLRADRETARREVNSEANRAVAKQAARESLVLLKNSGRTLPINLANFKRIAIVGPNADDRVSARAHYGPLGVPVSTVLSWFNENKPAGVEIQYAKGCDHKDSGWPESELIPTLLNPNERKMMDQAVDLAKQSDVTIVVLGDQDWVTVGENKSRTELSLPGRQEQLLQEVSATGTQVILVVLAGRPMTINWAQKNVPAILWSFFPGPEGGEAIGRALTGLDNPGGKLPVTFPKSVGQIPLAFPTKPSANHETGKGRFNEDQTSSGWAGVQGVLYPFGFGLSYTTFDYGALNISTDKSGEVTLRVAVKNSGQRQGDEIVQIYGAPVVTTITRYEQSLVGFKRVGLAPGETKTLEFKFKREDFGYRNDKGKLVVDPGAFFLEVASSSGDIRVKGKVEIK